MTSDHRQPIVALRQRRPGWPANTRHGPAASCSVAADRERARSMSAILGETWFTGIPTHLPNLTCIIACNSIRPVTASTRHHPVVCRTHPLRT